jgi:hypothetical protein
MRAGFGLSGMRATALDMHDNTARIRLTRFRLGAHGLEVTKAANGGSADRRDRLCKCCNMNIVKDEVYEVHLIFECPLYI